MSAALFEAATFFSVGYFSPALVNCHLMYDHTWDFAVLYNKVSLRISLERTQTSAYVTRGEHKAVARILTRLYKFKQPRLHRYMLV